MCQVYGWTMCASQFQQTKYKNILWDNWMILTQTLLDTVKEPLLIWWSVKWHLGYALKDSYLFIVYTDIFMGKMLWYLRFVFPYCNNNTNKSGRRDKGKTRLPKWCSFFKLDVEMWILFILFFHAYVSQFPLRNSDCHFVHLTFILKGLFWKRKVIIFFIFVLSLFIFLLMDSESKNFVFKLFYFSEELISYCLKFLSKY